MSNHAEAQRFLTKLDPSARSFTFQVFDDGPDKKKELARTLIGSLSEVIDFLEEYSAQGAGVFVTVNETNGSGRKAKDIIRVRALFVDLDGAPLQPLLDETKFPTPDMVVESSPARWHAYWFVEGLSLEDFSWAQKALIQRYGADPAIHDLPRVMRVPGFLHRKGADFSVRIISLDEGSAFSGADMLATLKKLMPDKPKVVTRAVPSGDGENETRALNQEALAYLTLWVPKIFPEAIEVNGGFRVTSAMLGRDLEEDLSLMPSGIKDFGIHDIGDAREGGRTAIEIVQQYLGKDFHSAVAWLRLRVRGIDTIVMMEGHLIGIVEKAENALLGAGVPIYQRGGELVTPVKSGQLSGAGDGVRRERNSVVLHGVEVTWLIKKLSGCAKWTKMNAEGKQRSADPGRKYAETLIASKGEWRFPHLRGVVTAPTLASNGDIIETPGFHSASGLLLDFRSGAFPAVPIAPTRTDAEEALEKLDRPLRGFPFVDDASRSVALSAMLSALIRPSLRTVPLHGFDAPVAGTGKSLLAEIPGLLANGVKPASMSQGKTAEEDEKRLSTVLHAGDNIIMIDNCTHQIQGDFLCSMLTQEVVQARILGLSERRILPCTALIVATANNLTFAGDVSRRAVKCSLDAHEERPDRREFSFDAQEEIKAARAELIVAGLTILRAYALAGRPVRLKPMGSFGDWAWVRGSLVWLGRADPADTREQILEADPRKGELSDVLAAWEKEYGERAIMLNEIGKVIGNFDDPKIALRTMLAEVSGKGQWNARSVGWWMRRNARRIVNGRCFIQHTDGEMGISWRIIKVDQMVTARSSTGTA